jgi:hypothetical protein
MELLQRLAYSLPGTLASRQRHSGENFANDRLIAAVIELEVGASHFDRSDGPVITEAHKARPGQSGIGRVKAKTICYRN